MGVLNWKSFELGGLPIIDGTRRMLQQPAPPGRPGIHRGPVVAHLVQLSAGLLTVLSERTSSSQYVVRFDMPQPGFPEIAGRRAYDFALVEHYPGFISKGSELYKTIDTHESMLVEGATVILWYQEGVDPFLLGVPRPEEKPPLPTGLSRF